MMASSFSSSLGNSTVLTAPEDWGRWIDKLRAYVHPELWPFIDPESDNVEALLEKPIRPTIQQVNATAATIANLNSTQLKAYELLCRNNESDLKEYDKQTQRTLEARRYITNTVSPAKLPLLDPARTIYEWLRALKDGTKPSRSYMTAFWKREYRGRLRVKIPRANKVSQWLDEWETVMANAIKYNLSDIDNGQWLHDLAVVVKPLSDTLYMHLKLQAVDENHTEVTRYLLKSKEIREVLDSNNAEAPSRTVRGSTFAVDSVGQVTSAQSTATRQDTLHSIGSTRKRAITRTSGSDQPTKRTSYKCPACEGAHPLSECWYVFTNKVPQGRFISSRKRRRIQEIIENDVELREEVETLRQNEA
jgi:hypothetical protein